MAARRGVALTRDDVGRVAPARAHVGADGILGVVKVAGGGAGRVERDGGCAWRIRGYQKQHGSAGQPTGMSTPRRHICDDLIALLYGFGHETCVSSGNSVKRDIRADVLGPYRQVFSCTFASRMPPCKGVRQSGLHELANTRREGEGRVGCCSPLRKERSLRLLMSWLTSCTVSSDAKLAVSAHRGAHALLSTYATDKPSAVLSNAASLCRCGQLLLGRAAAGAHMLP